MSRGSPPGFFLRRLKKWRSISDIVRTGAEKSMSTPIASGVLNDTPDSFVSAKDARLTRPWSFSDDGLKFLAYRESSIINGKYKGMDVRDGFILQVYDDGYGYPTVGLGYMVRPEDKLKIGDKITIDRAKNFLKQHLKELEGFMNKTVKVPLFQHEYDALISFAFNIGSGNFNKSSVLKALLQGNYKSIPDRLMEYDKVRVNGKLEASKGLINRRRKESDLFEKANYGF